MQAAFLDLKLAGVLGELLGRLVPVLAQGPDAGSLCTMVLEAILTLQDPETCLNPMAPAVQRVPDETPAPTEVSICQAAWCINITMRAAGSMQPEAGIPALMCKLQALHHLVTT